MNFLKLLPKNHFAEFGRRTSKNSVALTVAIRELVQRQKLFVVSFYTTYWKDEFFQRHLRVNVVRVYGVTLGNFFPIKLISKNFIYIFPIIFSTGSTK